MIWKILIAHAPGEEGLAESLAGPLREAGYEVAHLGTVMVGESVVEEASKVLSTGGPVVLCGTVRAMGTKWARRLVNAARLYSGVRVFIVKMEEDADVDSVAFDDAIACYWEDPSKAVMDLLASLQRHFPQGSATEVLPAHDAEARYRELALESCDIINLANLPEQDRHIATQRLELRRLYVPLRARVEVGVEEELREEELDALEKRRAAARGRWSAWERSERREREGAGKRMPVGERLAKARRLAVLGDPGAGKSTLLRWIVTAYLLRLKRDPDWNSLPDVATLPDEDWLPVLIRCRDLPQPCLGGPLDDILCHTLRKAEMTKAESDALVAYLLGKLRRGEALLLLDGLDEISDTAQRARFCEQIERVQAAYPQAPIIATSRIVGYREMGRRIGRRFEHLTIADLEREEKDDFARRWCALTERPERREAATVELIHDIHSSERIERLTGNPMLLTTLALVKRKVGKLPSRRVELYGEALEVLLNWRAEVDEPLDKPEAEPQLEYLAYAMCDRGVQQLREDEVLELFERMREKFPQVYAAREHTPEDFLRLLERRTGILVEAGRVRHKGREALVYEFRHLTFQEYLAGLALVDGRFPGYAPGQSLAQAVAPLAGRTGEERGRYRLWDVRVGENWREALRLGVAACADKEVDGVLRAILNPLAGEDFQKVARPRAVLAALCLADEPNVSDAVAREVLSAFVGQVGTLDGGGYLRTSLSAAALELAVSRWGEMLCSLLVAEFRAREAASRDSVGGLLGAVAVAAAPEDEAARRTWLTQEAKRLSAGEEQAIRGALALAEASRFPTDWAMPSETIRALLDMLGGSAPTAHAAAWALGELNSAVPDLRWSPSATERGEIIAIVANPASDTGSVRWLIEVLRQAPDPRALKPLLARLEDEDEYVRSAAARALGVLGDARAVEPLIARLEDEYWWVRFMAARALGEFGDARAFDPLLARLEDEDENVRSAAAWALGQLGDARAVEPLLVRLEDEDGDARSAAARALGELGDARAVEPLIARLEDEEGEVRYAAARALGQLGNLRAVEPLLARLEDEWSEVRYAAAEALGRLGDARVVEPLIARLEDEESNVRSAAAGALGQLGDARGIETLMSRLSADDPQTRCAALGGLSQTLAEEVERKLLSRNLDARPPYLDPQQEISEARVEQAARTLKMSVEEVRRHYEALAARFGLKLAWRAGGGGVSNLERV